MARKLSHIARCAYFLGMAGIALLGAGMSLAQSEIEVTAPDQVIENPFASSQPKPRIVPEEPQTSRRGPITYQNPFAAMSKSPPVDTSLRPGPVSRWQRPKIANDEPSPIKSAVLTTQPDEPNTAPWDQLPAAEELRHRAAAREETDPTFYSRLVNVPDTIRFTPKSLAQPTWFLVETNEAISTKLRSLPREPAVFEAPLKAAGLAEQTIALSPDLDSVRADRVVNAFSLDSFNTPSGKIELSPTIVSDCVDTPEGWLEQAQHSAKTANSIEDLSIVIELCDRGVRGGPAGELSSSLRRLSAWAHNRRGELQADAGRTDEALHDFQIAISLDSKCSLAIHNRAVTLAQQHQFAAALRDFNRVIELNPGLAVAYRNRAELLAALGRMDEAVADYNQALESLPNDSQLFRGRAYCYQRLGDFHKALIDLNRSIEISPNEPDAMTQRGNLAAENGNFEQAIADFQRAVDIDPNWADAYRSLAWLRATCPNPQLQNPQQAITAAEQAAKLSPGDDYLILDTLAAARASGGQFKQAIDIQEKALANAPPELVPSLEKRLQLYQHGRAFRAISAPTAVRAVSHESPSDPTVSDSSSQ